VYQALANLLHAQAIGITIFNINMKLNYKISLKIQQCTSVALFTAITPPLDFFAASIQ
jgi:hypothetical protein